MKLDAPSLERAIAYKNDAIVDRFLGHYDVEVQLAEAFFIETKKWLWLCGRAHADRQRGAIDFRLIIDEYLIFIDEMWHNLILFTKEYDYFCRSFCGAFIHHNPTPPKSRRLQHAEVLASEAAHDALLETRKMQYGYIYDQLGSKTLTLWYKEFGPVYNKAWFAARRHSG